MIKKMLTKSQLHLQIVNESYIEHQQVSFRYARQCLKASLMAFTHGVMPSLFETGASDIVKELNKNRK